MERTLKCMKMVDEIYHNLTQERRVHLNHLRYKLFNEIYEIEKEADKKTTGAPRELAKDPDVSYQPPKFQTEPTYMYPSGVGATITTTSPGDPLSRYQTS